MIDDATACSLTRRIIQASAPNISSSICLDAINLVFFFPLKISRKKHIDNSNLSFGGIVDISTRFSCDSPRNSKKSNEQIDFFFVGGLIVIVNELIITIIGYVGVYLC